MLQELSIVVIKFYQKFLSQHKGYECAYRVLNEGQSCSAIGLQIFELNQFPQSIQLLEMQFNACHNAALTLKAINHPKAMGAGCCGSGCSC